MAKTKYSNVIIFVSFLVFIMCLTAKAIIKNTASAKEIEHIGNLMIVAHPDDESIWGGYHLMNQNYLVVCVTCGSDKNREEEFEKAMEMTNSKYIALNFPDLTNGKKDDWKEEYSVIKNSLSRIIGKKKWNTIVTHNPDGEYGHIHHKKISQIVTKLTDKNTLYYFNDYYSYDETDRLDYSNYKEKKELLKVYKSQTAIIRNHKSAAMHEKFIPYSEWKND